MVSVRVERCTVMFLVGHFLFTCWDNFAVRCIIYSHSITDRQTDRQHCDANSHSYYMEYDRLAINSSSRYRLFCSVDVCKNFLGMFSGDGSTDRGLVIQRITNLHGVGSRYESWYKLWPNVAVYKHSCTVWTDLQSRRLQITDQSLANNNTQYCNRTEQNRERHASSTVEVRVQTISTFIMFHACYPVHFKPATQPGEHCKIAYISVNKNSHFYENIKV